MHAATPIHASPSMPRTRWQRIRASAAARWVAALICVGVPFIAANILLQLLIPEPGMRDARNLIKACVLVGGYWGYVRLWERRPVQELSLKGAMPETLGGLLLGGLLFSAVVGVLALLGAYSLDAVGTAGALGAVVTSMLPKIAAGALIEEVLFRLLLLRLLERSFGPLWALLGSSLLFGLAHLGNAGATPLVSVLLGLELGLLFGAAYLLTRRLWLAAAMHLAWNFAQGPIWSIAVSGQTGDAWLQGTLTGPTWLTGGVFGAEGSVVAVVLCLATSAVLLALASRRGTLRMPHAATLTDAVGVNGLVPATR